MVALCLGLGTAGVSLADCEAPDPSFIQFDKRDIEGLREARRMAAMAKAAAKRVTAEDAAATLARADEQAQTGACREALADILAEKKTAPERSARLDPRGDKGAAVAR